jgi:hypothetical protein
MRRSAPLSLKTEFHRAGLSGATRGVGIDLDQIGLAPRRHFLIWFQHVAW